MPLQDGVQSVAEIAPSLAENSRASVLRWELWDGLFVVGMKRHPLLVQPRLGQQQRHYGDGRRSERTSYRAACEVGLPVATKNPQMSQNLQPSTTHWRRVPTAMGRGSLEARGGERGTKREGF